MPGFTTRSRDTSVRLEARDPAEANPVARMKEKRLAPGRVVWRERRPADDVPAAGRRGRIDAGLPAGDCHRAHRDRRPRRGTPWRGYRRVHLGEVRESRHEADEVN